MTADYQTYLAAKVLNDASIVTYRTLSRDLKVHNNAAKMMLYEFRHLQNMNKPGSIYATFLVCGARTALRATNVDGHSQEDDEDAHMQSSPFMSSSAPPQDDARVDALMSVITLVGDKDLEAVKSKYDEIHSVHIYSLGPGMIENLQILSDCTRVIAVKHANEDPLETGRLYGVIQNAQVKRRKGPRPALVAPVVTAVKSISTTSSMTQKRNGLAPNSPKASDENVPRCKVNNQQESKPDMDSQQPKNGSKRAIVKTPAIKREQSDFFKSMSKPKTKLDRENTDSSTGASPAPTIVFSEDASTHEDEIMKDASEDEQEEDFMDRAEANPIKGRKAKSERTEQLRKMMDDEDEEENTPDHQPIPSQELEPIDAPDLQTQSALEVPALSNGGRRRGRRKVMRKKMLKDEEGYLVTKEEPAWESFSEDEPPLQKAKNPTSTVTSVGKGKKVVGKPGQGNIMSFFGKK
ncbi:hypothetical protein MMC12_001661 [Toensbergia leucococca]|nr:hypothetical protein [Toensbergia leucococca]